MTSNSQSTKSLGQVAFEAWVGSRAERAVSGAVFYTWDGQCSAGQGEDWQAAAEAVAVKVLREQPNIIIADHELHPDAKQAIMENTRKHNAVIEAAKALAPKLRNMPPDLLVSALQFCLAVEALQEVEGD